MECCNTRAKQSWMMKCGSSDSPNKLMELKLSTWAFFFFLIPKYNPGNQISTQRLRWRGIWGEDGCLPSPL